MRKFFQGLVVALCLPLAFVGVGCSAALKWGDNNLPCDTNVINGNTYFCLADYSCQAASLRCVADASLGEGEQCSLQRQCGAGSHCPMDRVGGGGVAGQDGVQQCLASCVDTGTDGGYYQPAACTNQSQVCLPFLNQRNSETTRSLLGGCLPGSACTPGASCTLNGNDLGVCVQMSEVVTTCMVGCEVSWSPTLAYSDNCDSLHSCVPVGAVGNQAFTCQYNGQDSNTNPTAAIGGQTVRALGQSCSTVLAPCEKGLVCRQGICAEYCALTSNSTFPCPTGQSCCPFTTFSTSQVSGYCAAACSTTN